MVITVVPNRECNFCCSYCYQHNKSNIVMSDEVIDKLNKFIKYKVSQTGDNLVKINISGGECLLHPEKVKKIVNIIKQIEIDLKICSFEIELSTNMSCLSEDIIDFISKNKISLFVSIDGIKKSHNLNRKYLSNSSYDTFTKCIEKLGLITKYNLRNVVINSVIAKNNVRYLNRNVNYFLTNYPQYIYSINIAYNCDWDYLSLLVLRKQLKKLGKLYVRKLYGDKQFDINLFDRQMRTILKSELLKMNSECTAGRDSFCVTPEGDILACGLCIGMEIEEKFKLGCLDSYLEDRPLKKFDKTEIPKLCLKCALKTKCYNYCPVTNYLGGDNFDKPNFKKCKINKILIKESEYILDKLCKKDPEIVKNKYL